MLLVKFVAKSGLFSRRKSEEQIKAGKIKVNNKPMLLANYEVKKQDVVRFENKVLKIEEKFVYLIMNKPEKILTTLDDPKNRPTIKDILQDNKIKTKVHPVGRLDYMSSGLLLLSNDGDWSYKISHPKFEIKKTYQVKTKNFFTLKDLSILSSGLKLEDGFIKPDKVKIISREKNLIEITLHSGKNRIVRRMIEALGNQVSKLKRIQVGKWKLLDLPPGKVKFIKP